MFVRAAAPWAVMVWALAACGDDTRGGSGGSAADGSASATTGAQSSGSVATSAVSSSAAGSVASSSSGGAGLCAWAGEDPGTLVATGAAIGDVIENVEGLVDQCGVVRSLWGFAGGYRILSMTTGW